MGETWRVSFPSGSFVGGDSCLSAGGMAREVKYSEGWRKSQNPEMRPGFPRTDFCEDEYNQEREATPIFAGELCDVIFWPACMGVGGALWSLGRPKRGWVHVDRGN